MAMALEAISRSSIVEINFHRDRMAPARVMEELTKMKVVIIAQRIGLDRR